MEGFDKEFTFTPAEGCEILDVMIDGVSYGVIESYTFEDVMTDYTLEVEFSVTEDDEDDTDIPGDEGNLDTEDDEDDADTPGDEGDTDTPEGEDDSDIPENET